MYTICYIYTTHYYGYQIEVDETGRMYSVYQEYEKCIQH